MANEVRVIVTANTKDAEGKIDGFGKGLSSKMGTAAKVGVTALAGVGVAAGAAAVVGLKAFGGFQSGMNEVFTLLPGISDDAMKEMEGQVKDFSKEFGVLPQDTIPALYQALSAGVPPDNVFDFMETAQKAAKGGVTDLTTAVDGISSVVNAYGDDMISAGEASDLMFTAVKLGKTDMESLSSSLANVTPIAAGLGLGFGNVTAGLAAMTAQGTPTAQATTQMQQLLVELSKSGGKAAETFETMAGQTFQEFIAAGGDLNGALDLMGQAADDSGVGIQDMFGSIEAGKAALQLEGSEKFSEALAAMGDSAGATDEAFGQMNQGVSADMEKLNANFEVMKIAVGEKLAPAMEAFTSWLLENIPKWEQTLREWWEASKPYVEEAIRIFKEDVIPVLKDIGAEIEVQFKKFMVYYESDIKPAVDNIVAAIGSIIDFVVEHWDEISAVIEPVMAQVQLHVETTVGIIRELLQIIIDLVGGDFSGAWLNFKELIGEVWAYFEGTIQNGLDFLKGLVQLFLAAGEAIGGAILEGLGKGLGAITGIATDLKNGLINAMKSAWNSFVDWMDNNLKIEFTVGALGMSKTVSIDPDLSGFKLAQGTRSFAGGMALVGESGPELVKLPTGASVFSNAQSLQMMGPGGRTVVNVNIYGVADTPDALTRQVYLGLQRAGVL